MTFDHRHVTSEKYDFAKISCGINNAMFADETSHCLFFAKLSFSDVTKSRNAGLPMVRYGVKRIKSIFTNKGNSTVEQSLDTSVLS